VSDISDGAQIYPIEEGDTVLEPDEARINLMGRIWPTWAAATVVELDGGRINPAGQIYQTWGRICPTWQCGHVSVSR
jgi:hypothetical protein